MITSKCFKEYEFKACSPGCSLQDMEQSTIDRFDVAREIAGVPFVPVSAYRSVEWELSKGRSGKGGHPKRRALDLECDSSRERFLIVNALIEAGFKRIGIAKTFIHADDAEDLAQRVIWMY
jgi:rhodanese-related sulfurtransferase